MTTLGGSVGRGGVNRPDDVRAVQALLARHAAWLAPALASAVTGIADPATIAAITRFQETAAALATADGRVDPGGFTLRRLDLASIPRPVHPVLGEGPFTPVLGAPSAEDYAAAAALLGCEVAAIQAVSQVEVGIRGPFDERARPTILFERHKFSRHSGGAFDATHPDISNPSAGGYGRFSEQYPKLRRAATLDEAAALKSASWGGYQILGENHAQAGYGDVAAFVSAQMESERRQLAAFVAFVRGDAALLAALQARDWPTFARRYNGPGYARNAYDVKMAEAYAALTAPPAPAAPAAVPRPRARP